MLPEWIAGAAFITAVLNTTVNVIARYCFAYTFTWYSDLNILMFAWMIFMGCAAAYKENMHYGIDLLVDKLGTKTRAVYLIFTQIIQIVIVGVFLWTGWLLFSKVAGRFLASLFMMSYKWVYLAVPVSFAIMLGFSVKFLIDRIRALPAVMHGAAEAEEVAE